jgi:hypothetical protein
VAQTRDEQQTDVLQAHLTWYGVEYYSDDSKQELEQLLWDALSTRPPPSLDNAIFEVEAEMRQRFSEATRVEQER